ncbi:MAG: DegT/DnrJ/EryC1/StrS family aminotransferase [Kiritimatiellae bacterium]|nr:DegT/DnrJ/EryC1/StrS family aminotransferase [Verrucomicrobiota bacterium]MCG2660027.1 DegT/DnrJ/EryC1/StrS family aminotransferase [Kiritimatiellia bacterium]
MKVEYSYLKDQFASPEPILDAMREQLTRCEFTFGKEMVEFENHFAKYTGAKYALGVGSGTDALKLSLKAVGVGRGDEVVTVTQTFIATVGAIAELGAIPVFVDSNDDFSMNVDQVEAAITPGTRAILPVHYSGNPVDMKKLMKIAGKHNLPVVEDACCAISAAINGKHVGNFGQAGGFSLHPLKNLNVWGDGGVVITNSKAVYDKLILLRNHGLATRDDAEIFGYNSRLDTVQAIVGNYLIEQVEDITNKRIANANYYDRELSASVLKEYVRVPERKKGFRHVYHMYMFYAKRRDGLLKHLCDAGIEAKVHYPKAVHMQNCCKNYGLKYKPGDFPVAENQCKNIITLPVHQHLRQEQLDYVIAKVKEFYIVK